MRLESWALNLSRKLHGLNFDTCWFPELGCLFHSSSTEWECEMLALQVSCTALWGDQLAMPEFWIWDKGSYCRCGLTHSMRLVWIQLDWLDPDWIRLIQRALSQAGWLSPPSSYGLGCPYSLPMSQEGQVSQRSPRAMVFKPFIFSSITLSKKILCRMLNVQNRRAKLLWRKWGGPTCSLFSPDPEASLRNSRGLQGLAWNPWPSNSQLWKAIIFLR